jgi:hypothetical protein
MRQRMKLGGPSHATVVAYLALFVALGGGAMAASHLGKNTVGTKQLRKNSVTAKKIKKNAVTTAKIKNSAVNAAKVADGSLTGSDVNVPSMPFSQVVHKARGSSTLVLTNILQVYPLDNATYTQAANEDDGYVGAVDVTVPSTCTPPRNVNAILLVDPPDPSNPKPQDVGAVGSFYDPTSGTVTGRINLGTGTLDPGKFQPGTATSRTLTLVLAGTCGTGGGITASFAGVDVIGTTS